MFRLTSCLATCVVLVVVFLVPTAPASTIEIQFSGLDIVYDGSSFVDAGGSVDPPDADRLETVTYQINGSPVGTDVDDIYADFDFGPVTGIPVGGGTVNTGPDSGVFEILIPGVGLALDLDDVSVTYLPLGSVDFVFAGSLAGISGQSLPLGLIIGDPVSVSFSAQINAGTISDDGTNITGFTAAGNGEVRGTLIPEPSALGLLGMGAVGLVGYGLRRSRKRSA